MLGGLLRDFLRLPLIMSMESTEVPWYDNSNLTRGWNKLEIFFKFRMILHTTEAQ